MSNENNPAKKYFKVLTEGWAAHTLSIAILFLAAASLCAQAPAAIPVPSQLATARTVFLASGAAPGSGRHETLITQMVYTSLYKSLSAAGLYQLVGTPASAELSMVISTQNHVSSVTNGNSRDDAFLRLEINDIKTHTLLWAIDEPIMEAFREKTFQKNVDQTVADLITDLKALASGVIPGNPATTAKSEPSKTRLTDQKKD